MDQSRPTIRDVLRTVVADIAPDELADLDDLLDGYVADPRGAERSARARAAPNASAADFTLIVLGQLAVGVACEIGADLARDAAAQGWKKVLSRFRPSRSSQTPSPDKPAPELSPERVDAVRAAATASALRRGATPAQASVVTDALVGAWPAPR